MTGSNQAAPDMVNHLQKREDERKTDVLKRREERGQEFVIEESFKFFNEKFAHRLTVIESKLTSLVNLNKDVLPQYFDQIANDIVELRNYISESIVFLTQYDIRVSQNAVLDIHNKLQEYKSRLIPKKKFAFKSKERNQDNSESENKSLKAVTKVKNALNIDLTDCKFMKKNGETLTKYCEEINQKDIALVELNNCVIKLYGSPSAVHINELVDCKVFCGPLSGSMFIQGCSNCVFIVACQQLRIHTTTQSCFYMHVTSRAIIEDCSGIRVAKYTWEYPDIHEHYALSGLDRSVNNWNLVNDFNWLSSSIQSPNWSILDDAEKIFFELGSL